MSGSTSNNMVLDCGSSDPNRGVYYDVHETNVSRRYKGFGAFSASNGAAVGSSKLGTVVSADGIVWSDYTPTGRTTNYTLQAFVAYLRTAHTAH